MMAEEKNNNFALLALVAIVAVVGLVVLMMGNTNTQYIIEKQSVAKSSGNAGGHAASNDYVSLIASNSYATEFSSSDNKVINAENTIATSTQSEPESQEEDEVTKVEQVPYEGGAEDGMHVETVEGSSSFTIGQGTFDDAEEKGEITFDAENEFSFILGEDISFSSIIYVSGKAILDCDNHLITFPTDGKIITLNESKLKNCKILRVNSRYSSDPGNPDVVSAYGHSQLHDVTISIIGDDACEHGNFYCSANAFYLSDYTESFNLKVDASLLTPDYTWTKMNDYAIGMFRSAKLHGCEISDVTGNDQNPTPHSVSYYGIAGLYADSAEKGDSIEIYDCDVGTANMLRDYLLRGDVLIKNSKARRNELGFVSSNPPDDNNYKDKKVTIINCASEGWRRSFSLLGKFEIMDSKASDDDYSSDTKYGFYITSYYDSLVENCEAHGSEMGFYVEGDGDITIENSLSEGKNNEDYGFYINAPAGNVHVIDSTAEKNEFYGFRAIGNVQIEDSTATENGAEGFRLEDGSKGINLNSHNNDLGVYVKDATLVGSSSKYSNPMSSLCDNSYDNVDLYVDNGGTVSDYLKLDSYYKAREGNVEGAHLYSCDWEPIRSGVPTEPKDYSVSGDKYGVN